MLDAAWKWLPKTAIFLNAQQGYIFYLNEAEATANNKASSYPAAWSRPGLRGLLTEKTSAMLALGYTNGFYARQRLDRRVLGQHLRRPVVHAASDDAQPHRRRLPARLSERGRSRRSRTTRPSTRRTSSRSRAGWRWTFRAATRTGTTGASSSTRCRWRPVGRTTSSRWARRSTTSSATGSTPVSAIRCSRTAATSRSVRIPEAADVCPARPDVLRLRRCMLGAVLRATWRCLALVCVGARVRGRLHHAAAALDRRRRGRARPKTASASTTRSTFACTARPS